MTPIVIVTTTKDHQEAKQIAHDLVVLKLAASAQISVINSVYRWQGELCETQEFQVSIKAIAANYHAIETAITQRHSYDVPEIYAIPMGAMYPPYRNWLVANAAP
ncbi:MAG: divalent-cation tolerance protein CutA [Limnothrix sp. RL_2_0]|nr:divalent-cation tolerance protein CutA [Limnothrix sp. RL_2_0]